MEPDISITNRLVKNEDLNHHGTLYAGRCAEWFVEAGFVAAAGLVPPENIVCLKIHGMTFHRPVRPGEILGSGSRIVLAGRSSLHAYVRMEVKGQIVTDGFVTFVHVDQGGRAAAHGVAIDAAGVDRELLERLKGVLERERGSKVKL